MLIDIPEYSRTPLVRGYRGKDNKLIAQVSPKTGAHTIRTLIGKTFDDNAGRGGLLSFTNQQEGTKMG
jgi:hypothetical protein